MKEKFEIVSVDTHSDLHNHTKGSDGKQSSFRFLLRASNKGKDIVSISDHDSVKGYKNLANDLYSVIETIKEDKSYSSNKIGEIIEMLEGIKILKGTELITSYNGCIIEVLGYNFDVDKMEQEIERLKTTVEQKATDALYEGFNKIIEEKEIVFNREGLDEAYQKVKQEGRGGVVGPFFNELLSHEENLPFLSYKDENGEEKIADNLKLFINKHLYNKRSPFFVDMSKTRPSYEDTIEAIHRAEGITSLAHPGRYNDKFDVLENIDDMIEKGLDCVEVFYPDHSTEFRKALLEKVQEHGIKASGGSDDHHSVKEGIQYEMGRVAIPDIYETAWIQESVESGLDFVKGSEKMQEALRELKQLKEERQVKLKEKQELDKKIEISKVNNGEKEYE